MGGQGHPCRDVPEKGRMQMQVQAASVQEIGDIVGHHD